MCLVSGELTANLSVDLLVFFGILILTMGAFEPAVYCIEGYRMLGFPQANEGSVIAGGRNAGG